MRARLLELAPTGCEEVEHEGEVELAIYTDDAGESAARAMFPQAASDAVAPGWEERWRAFHRPVRAGGLWIGPPWEPPPPDELTVVIDPGRAFGTGGHPTTRACIELLATDARRGSVLDAGCGSGVVAVAAAKLGFHPVRAVDSDPVAVTVAEENAAVNGVTVDVRRRDVLRDELPAAEVVVANIELSVVEALLPRLAARRAITSGYLAGETPAAPRWHACQMVELDGWAAHVFEPA